MITDIKNGRPFIDLGFGILASTIPAGQSITAWLQDAYDDGYTAGITCPGASSESISMYEHRLTYSAPGIYEVYVTVYDKDKTSNVVSNTIVITVE